MIKIENVDVSGWEAAIRGMRNPLNSWDKSDSKCHTWHDGAKQYIIGENDLALMKKLSAAGSDHAKYLRMIAVSMDITAPLYWWKEFDTYKVGTVANSCSTMYTIHRKAFTLDDFSYEHLIGFDNDTHDVDEPLGLLNHLIDMLNEWRESFIESKDKIEWWQIIQLLPTSYNQRRTVTLNYQVLKSMYHARKAHKLDEWREFCKWAETLPYFKEICVEV